MKKLFVCLGWVFLALTANVAHAALNVFACEPEWGALVQEIAGDKASVFVATTARQDPHHIEARPTLIAKVRNADLVICTGLELETGWLPILLQHSANSKIQPGQLGYLEIGLLVPRLEIPSRLDRSDGDVHASGNPHIQQDPRNIQRAADALLKRLSELDPPNSTTYQVRYKTFSERWSKAQQLWAQKALPLKGALAVAHHKDMSYLWNWLGIKEVGTLEVKPGVEPSTAHLSDLLSQLQRTPARFVVRTPYQSARASEWLSAQARLPAVELPFTVGGDEKTKDLFGLFDVTLQRLLEAKP